jgi:hypothetical protein
MWSGSWSASGAQDPAVDYTDPTTHELRFWSGAYGVAVRWLEQLPSEWAPLAEVLARLEGWTPRPAGEE